MKYLALFAFLAIAICTRADSRDILVHQAENILKTAQDTLDFLAKNNRANEGKNIENDVELLKKTIVELKADTTQANIAKHENEMKNIERRLITEIRQAHTRPTNQLRERLLEITEKLVKKVDEAIKEMTAQKKTEEVEKFQAEKAKVMNIAEELKRATDQGSIFELEHKLLEIEFIITVHLKAIHKHPAPPTSLRHKRDVLLAEANQLQDRLLEITEKLVKKVDEAIKEMTAQKKTEEVEKFQADKTKVMNIAEELKRAKDQGSIIELEHKLLEIEFIITVHLKAIHKHPAPPTSLRHKRDVRDVLLAKANQLVVTLETAIEMFTEQNRTHEVNILKKEEESLKKLVSELKETHDHHNLIKVENELVVLEIRISQQLQRLERTPEFIRQEILDTFAKFSQAVEEKVKELKEKNFKAFAEEIQHQLNDVAELVEQLNTTKDHEGILKLDEKIFHVTERIKLDLEILHRDLEAYNRLLNVTQELLDNVQHVISELEARNLTDAIELLRVDVEELNLIEDQLKKEKSILVFDYLEEKLVSLEQRLTAKLYQIERELRREHPPHRARRSASSDLLENSSKLLSAARQAIEKLKAEGKHDLAAGLEKIEKFLLDVDTQIRNLHPHTVIGQAAQKALEALLKKGEDALEAELKRLGLNN